MFLAPEPPTSAPIRALVEDDRVHRSLYTSPELFDRALAEAWSLRTEGGPDLLLQRGLTYNRWCSLPCPSLPTTTCTSSEPGPSS